MPVSDYNDSKFLKVTSVSGTPTISKAQPILLVDGSLYHNGFGFVRINFDNISDAQDIGVYDESGNLLDYEVEFLGGKSAVLWVYNDWVRDGSRGARVAFGNNSANTDRQNVTGTWGNSGQNTVAAWHLDETSGQTIDSTSNNFDSTSTTGTVYDTNGEFNGARDFNGTDDEILFSSNTFPSGDFTAICWTNIDQLSSNKSANQDPVGMAANNNEAFAIEYPKGTDGARGVIGTGSGLNVVDSTTTLSANTWFNTGVRYDSSTSTFGVIVDGTEENTISSGYSAGTTDMSIGAAINQFLDGTIDAVRIYSDKKSDAWLTAEYDASPKAGRVFFKQEMAESVKGGDVGFMREARL